MKNMLVPQPFKLPGSIVIFWGIPGIAYRNQNRIVIIFRNIHAALPY